MATKVGNRHRWRWKRQHLLDLIPLSVSWRRFALSSARGCETRSASEVKPWPLNSHSLTSSRVPGDAFYDQPSGDYETCQHPVAKNRYSSHHVAAVSRPCRKRVVSMSRHVATCRERVAGMSRRVASVSRRVAGMSRACRGHVATCRAASCDVTQRRKVSPHRPTQPLAAWPLK